MFTSASQSAHTIIGKGKYGCVIKPALKCMNIKQPPKNTISKITNKEEAEKEHKFMSDLRKNPEMKKYILYSTVCNNPEISDNSTTKRNGKINHPFKSIFEDCKSDDNFIIKKDFTTLEARLLQMEYGGPTMRQYVEYLPNKPKESQKQFLEAISKIIHCLELFQKYEVMHCDIKIDNILYNEKSGDIKIIDFGLAHTIDDYKNKMRIEPIFEKSDYQPPESQFGDENSFKEYFSKKETKHENCKCLKCQVYQGYTQDDYETFLDDSVKTFDSYLLAVELQDMFEFISNKAKYHTNITYECKELMKSYCDISVKNRTKDLGQWKTDYEEKLKQYKDAAYVYDPKETYLNSINEIEKQISSIDNEKDLKTLFRELDKINNDYKTIMGLKEDENPEEFKLVFDKILLQKCIIKEGSESDDCKNIEKRIAEAEKRIAKQREAEQREAEQREAEQREAEQNVIEREITELNEQLKKKLPKGGKTKRKPKLRTRNKKLRSNKKRRHGKKTYKKRKTTRRK